MQTENRANIKDINFDHGELELEFERDDEIKWRSSFGEIISVHFFPIPPDLPAPVHDLSIHRESARVRLAEISGAVIEVEIAQLGDYAALHQIFKLPMKPSGMLYIASYTIPFQTCSFVIKAQCPEVGATGIRDALVADMSEVDLDELENNRIVIIEGGKKIPWMQDPYEPNFEAPLLRNRSEDRQWDAEFPDHPLSRARKFLEKVKDSFSAAASLRVLPPFA